MLTKHFRSELFDDSDIANIDSVTIVQLQRDYIYDTMIHFNPDFFRIRYHLWIGD
jgi:hypothetical protein